MTAQQKLVDLYVKAEKRLISLIADKEARGNVTAYWQSLLRQVRAQLKKLRAASPALVKQTVEDAYNNGLRQLQDNLKSAGDTRLVSSFASLNTRQIDILARNLSDDLAAATVQLGRRVEDEIRRIGLEATAQKVSTGQTVRELQQRLRVQLLGLDPRANDGRLGIQYKDGKVSSISSYAKMAARTTTAESQNVAQTATGQALGYDLVRCTIHSPTCGVCATYQGRVYALTDEAANGKYDGPDGEPLRFPLLYQTALVHGYHTIHPNCRHRFAVLPAMAYTRAELAKMSRESMAPFVDTRSDAERKAYAKTQAENRRRRADGRQYERIRAALPDDAPKSFAAFRSMKAAKSERYRDLMADYRTVLKSVRDRDILESQAIEFIPITQEAIDRVSLPSVPDWSDDQNRRLQEAMRDTLRRAQNEPLGTEVADIYSADIKTRLGMSTGTAYGSVRVPTTREPHVVIHNHPAGETFSTKDVRLFLRRSDMAAIVAVGNNGSTYILKKADEIDVDRAFVLLGETNDDLKATATTPTKAVSIMEDLFEKLQYLGFVYLKG